MTRTTLQLKKGIFGGLIDSKNKIICDFIYDSMGSVVNSNYIFYTTMFNESIMKVIVKKGGKEFWINEKSNASMDVNRSSILANLKSPINFYYKHLLKLIFPSFHCFYLFDNF